jgi:large subunit ribosomal protein L19
MGTPLTTFAESHMKKELPDMRPGDTVKVFLKTKEKNKEKMEFFEGVVIARKHNKEMGGTLTVRKMVGGIGVERIFPIHSPVIAKIDVLRKGKVRRAKLYYLRDAQGKRAKIKEKKSAK